MNLSLYPFSKPINKIEINIICYIYYTYTDGKAYK